MYHLLVAMSVSGEHDLRADEHMRFISRQSSAETCKKIEHHLRAIHAATPLHARRDSTSY